MTNDSWMQYVMRNTNIDLFRWIGDFLSHYRTTKGRWLSQTASNNSRIFKKGEGATPNLQKMKTQSLNLICTIFKIGRKGEVKRQTKHIFLHVFLSIFEILNREGGINYMPLCSIHHFILTFLPSNTSKKICWFFLNH